LGGCQEEHDISGGGVRKREIEKNYQKWGGVGKRVGGGCAE